MPNKQTTDKALLRRSPEAYTEMKTQKETDKDQDRVAEKEEKETAFGEVANFLLFMWAGPPIEMRRGAGQDSISFGQLFLLAHLQGVGHLTMTDISKKMGHSTAAATGLVDRLEKLGYVERKHSAEDRRKVCVFITKRGEEVVERAKKALAKTIENTFIASVGEKLTAESESGSKPGSTGEEKGKVDVNSIMLRLFSLVRSSTPLQVVETAA